MRPVRLTDSLRVLALQNTAFVKVRRARLPRRPPGRALTLASHVLPPLQVKANNAGVLALGYTQALRPGVKVSFGAALDISGQTITAPKVGSSLTFEA